MRHLKFWVVGSRTDVAIPSAGRNRRDAPALRPSTESIDISVRTGHCLASAREEEVATLGGCGGPIHRLERYKQNHDCPAA